MEKECLQVSRYGLPATGWLGAQYGCKTMKFESEGVFGPESV